ncbi:hypothetical protein [Archaeoglobus sp.]
MLFGKKKGILDRVFGFFDSVDRILGIFEELIEEGRELIDFVENEIRRHEEEIKVLQKHKEEIEGKIERLRKVLGDA